MDSPYSSPGISARYKHLETKRTGVLCKARECAELTLPSILPPDGHTEGQELPTPVNSIGARGVNHLASKLLLALFPPNGAWFKFGIPDEIEAEIGEDKVAEARLILSGIERSMLKQVEQSNSRSVHFAILKHLIVTGNVLQRVYPDLSVRHIPLSSYVVERDPQGNAIRTIMKEEISYSVLSEELQGLVRDKHPNKEFNPESILDIYTEQLRKSNEVVLRQEIEDIEVPNSTGTYKHDEAPLTALRWTIVAGNNYGEGLCEQYLGDLRSLEGMRQSLLDINAAMSRIIYFVKPGSVTKKRVIEKARSGDVVTGDANDVTTLALEKLQEFSAIYESASDIARNLANAFLLNSSVQRQAERVTAEEIRIVAGELEDSLGGVYSLLAQDLQLPYLKFIIKKNPDAKKKLPENVDFIIIAGLQALSRGHEDTRLNELVRELGELGIPVDKYVNIDELVNRKIAAKGIDPKGLVKSKEQLRNDQEDDAAKKIAEATAPGLIQGAAHTQTQSQQ